MKNKNIRAGNISQVNKELSEYAGFVHKSEDEKLKENIFRSPIEKLQLFTRMLKRESLLKSAKTIHK